MTLSKHGKQADKGKKMEKLIAVLFFVACAECVGIVNQSVDNGNVLIAGMFVFYGIITAIGGMVFIRGGK